jgi:hypothetical protein
VLAFCNCTALHGGTCPGHAGKTGDSTQQIEGEGCWSRRAEEQQSSRVKSPRQDLSSPRTMPSELDGMPTARWRRTLWYQQQPYAPPDLNILLARRAAALMLSCCSSMPSHQLQLLEGAAANLAGERPGLII